MESSVFLEIAAGHPFSKRFPFLGFLLILSLMLSSCARYTEDKKKLTFKPEIDQIFTTPSGKITMARTHYPMARTDSMNRMRKNQTLALMRKTCKGKEIAIIRQYKTQSDFVSLKNSFVRNHKVHVFEFNCRP